MKKHCLPALLAGLLLGVSTSYAQELRYEDASQLNIIGKPLPTTRPFTRVDTSAYSFNSRAIEGRCDQSTGLAVLFATDSRIISARWITSDINSGPNMAAIGQKGLDLYIRRDGEWVFAGVGTPEMSKGDFTHHNSTIVSDMEPGLKECLLYLPLFDRVDSLEIGIEDGASIEPLANPFRHRIVFKGSSITHGASASRPGMSYVARFGRDNGLYCMNLGFSGVSKLEKEYALFLKDIEADAFVFDTFSNPSAEQINDRFDEFVSIIRSSHPETPLIFMQTERRETRNFSTRREAFEAAKQKAAEEKVRALMKRDRNVYFITSEDFLGDDHIATADGTHPTDLGFTRMLDSISPKILRILRKYGIR